MELKYEKVIRPFVALSKKRYTGLYVENADDTPKFFCKGIEVTRRDGCQAGVNLMAMSLLESFKSGDISKIKEELGKAWIKIEGGFVSPYDFIFQKEVKLGTYKVAPASAYAGQRLADQDPMLEPRRGERIRYIVVNSTGSKAIKHNVVPIQEYIKNNGAGFGIRSDYYINNIINASIGRFLGTLDIDIYSWYNTLSRKNSKRQLFRPQYVPGSGREGEGGVGMTGGRNTLITSFVKEGYCVVCGVGSSDGLCMRCGRDRRVALFLVHSKLKALAEK